MNTSYSYNPMRPRAPSRSDGDFNHPRHLKGYLGRRVKCTHAPRRASAGFQSLVGKSGVVVAADKRRKLYTVLFDDGRQALVQREFLGLDNGLVFPVDIHLKASGLKVLDLSVFNNAAAFTTVAPPFSSHLAPDFMRAGSSSHPLRARASSPRCHGRLARSDPFARVVVLGGDGREHELGRTEVVPGSQEPLWQAPVHVDYHPDEDQRLKVEVYDEDKQDVKGVVDGDGGDGGGGGGDKFPSLQGECWFTLRELMSAKNRTITKVLPARARCVRNSRPRRIAHPSSFLLLLFLLLLLLCLGRGAAVVAEPAQARHEAVGPGPRATRGGAGQRRRVSGQGRSYGASRGAP